MRPYDSIEELRGAMGRLPAADPQAAEAARRRQDSLTKPPGSLGRLEELAEFMAAWTGSDRPEISKAQTIVFAGNHGVCAQGVNPYPQEVTAQMVANFEAGGAAINQLCRVHGASLSVVTLELDRPTGDFTRGPAMCESECLEMINRGAAAVDPTADILLLGEMGIGNSTVAAALAAALFGGAVTDWVGPGTGSDAAGLARKRAAIAAGLSLHADIRHDGFGVLAALGGREQAAICGAVLQARSHRIPVILDGFICTAAVAPFFHTDQNALDHCLAGHVSTEPGHARLLEILDKRPVLNLDMRLGEGTGAVLALGVLKSALECHNRMATFGEAGVSEA